MLNLLAKDFKLLFKKEGSLSKRIIATIVEILMIAILLTIETVLFTMILNKIKDYSNAPQAFLTIFLAAVSIILIFIGVTRASKLFFNELDNEQLINHPIANDQIILSKIIFLFIMHYATSLLLVYPLFIAYGNLIGKTMWFYYIVVFYPFFSFFFEIGVSLLLVYPYKLFRDFLKKHVLIEFITSIVIMVCLAYVYSLLLDLFMQLVTNNNLNVLFSTKNIEKILNLRKYLVPINFLSDIFLYGYSGSFWSLICISLGVFIIGITISVFAFSYFRSLKFSDKQSRKKDLKVRSLKKALLRKECLLLFKDENYIFSFTGLLMTQPFFMYLVVASINRIFSSGSLVYYTTMLPSFVPLLDVFIILLFTVIISSGANQYITMEKTTIKILKTIPVSYKLQLGIKVLVPFLFSFVSLISSLVVLFAFKVIALNTFIFALVLSVMLLLVFDAVSLIEELNIRHMKPRQTLMSSLISYILPTLYFMITVIATYFGLNIYIAYIIGIVLFALCGFVLFIYLKKNIASKFMDLEMVN